MAKFMLFIKENKTILYVAIAFIVSFAFLFNVLFTIQLKFENSELQNEIAELENRIKGAKQELQQAKTDAYIEEEATQRLGMVKSNETPVKIYVEDSKSEEADNTKEDVQQDKIRIYLKDWYDELKAWLEQK